MIAFGWQQTAQIYAIVLAVVAVLFFLLSKEDPVTHARKSAAQRPRGTFSELEPLKKLQVWRFSLYYFFVFGAFVALALWLPRYLVGVYDLDIRTAGMLAAAYSVPASLFRAMSRPMLKSAR